MRAIDIIEAMNQWAMPSLIDKWDNTGFQIGNGNKEIKKILIALDLDRYILDIAIKEGYEMIITHHPLIFNPLNSIIEDDYKGKLIMDIIKNDLVVYNAHSNLDLAIGGVNDALARVLDIKNPIPLSKTLDEEGRFGYGRVGDIDKILLKDYLDKIKEKLDISNLIVHGDIDKKIKRVAVCGGSGSSFIYDAYNKNADIYITGDIKYHDGQLAHELGLVVVDAGHFHTEKIVLPIIKDYLVKKLNKKLNKKLDIKVITNPSIPYLIY